MNEFEPNWHSKTTRNRLRNIMYFAEDYFCWNDSTRRAHAHVLKKGFGQPQHALSKYFKENILFKTDNYLPKVQSYEYQFSWLNLMYYMNKSGLVTDEEVKLAGIENLHKRESGKPVSLCLSVFQNELKAKTFFDAWSLDTNWPELKFQNAEYVIDEFTLRRGHSFQNKSRQARALFWDGWYDYDVEACSYTLIHQHLINTVVPWWGKTNMTYTAIEQVYKNKKEVRSKLMAAHGLTEDVVKMLLSTILFNAKLVNHSKTGFYKALVKADLPASEIIEDLKSDKFIIQLIEELRDCWHKLFVYWNRTNGKSCRKIFRQEFISKETGEIKSKFNPARMRSRIYFELERQVSNCFDEFMTGKIYHLMHDGFFTPHQIDKSGLVKLIKDRTGFKVNISEDEL